MAKILCAGSDRGREAARESRKDCVAGAIDTSARNLGLDKTCQKTLSEQKGKEERWLRFPYLMIQQRGVVAGHLGTFNIRIMNGGVSTSPLCMDSEHLYAYIRNWYCKLACRIYKLLFPARKTTANDRWRAPKIIYQTWC